MSELREGYTTGSCAAAAALASCLWRRDGSCPQQVEIVLPGGRAYRPEIIAHEFPRCGVRKDAGDDPDITDGMEVLAWAEVIGEAGEITFAAGEGVGTVTEPGLKVPIGQPAINPVPRAMIADAVRGVYPSQAVRVTVSIPGGEAVARKTFNPRLGIAKGLSVLGTAGIVRPMSEDAIRETIALEMKMHRAKGEETLALAFGNQGEEALLLADPKWAGGVVQMSNFVGFALDTALELGFRGVLIAGHPGKMVKVAGGILHTHSRMADGRRETIAAHLALMGADKTLIQALFACRTTEAMIPLIENASYRAVWDRLADAGQAYCEARVRREMAVDLLFLDTMGQVLGRSARLRG